MYLALVPFWVGVVALLVRGIRGHARTGAIQTVPQLPQQSAVDVLKRRYAAGEMDVAESEHKKRDVL